MTLPVSSLCLAEGLVQLFCSKVLSRGRPSQHAEEKYKLEKKCLIFTIHIEKKSSDLYSQKATSNYYISKKNTMLR